jgi:chromosome segregation ATPase
VSDALRALANKAEAERAPDDTDLLHQVVAELDAIVKTQADIRVELEALRQTVAHCLAAAQKTASAVLALQHAIDGIRSEIHVLGEAAMLARVDAERAARASESLAAIVAEQSRATRTERPTDPDLPQHRED